MFQRLDLSPPSGEEPTQVGSIERASPYLWTPEPTQGRIYEPNTTETICGSYDTNFKMPQP
jgi:hypothetical protein